MDMKLKEALENFYINEVRIVYKRDIILMKNPSDIKMLEEENGLIGIDRGFRDDNPFFVFIILKKDVEYRESLEVHRLYDTDGDKHD